MPSINLSREELFERVWSKSMSQLAVELGVSDVALHKACRRMNIPKPPRGYWARLKSGRTGKKPKLPELPLAQRRKAALEKCPAWEHGEASIIREIPTLEQVKLPQSSKQLHPIALKLQTELQAVQPDPHDHQLLKIKGIPDLPRVAVSKGMAHAVAKVFHAVITELESRGIDYLPSQGIDNQPRIRCGQDSLFLSINEPIVTTTRKASEHEKRRPSWTWNLSSEKPAGRLVVHLDTHFDYDRSYKDIVQDPEVSLEVFTAQVIETIWERFMNSRRGQLEAHKQAEKECAKYEERRGRERIEEHQAKLAEVKAARMENLLWASQWCSIAQTATDFIHACEKRWQANSRKLTKAETSWLEWARQSVATLPTVDFAYPNPTEDGPFDPKDFPIDTPSPSVSHIPRPPTMQPPTDPSGCLSSYRAERHQYPFWLKHQR